MGKLDDIFSATKRFGVLSKLAKTLLVLPNSNADSERAFSIIKKIHTEFRSDLNNDTICGLLSCKFNQNQCCYDPHFHLGMRVMTLICPGISEVGRYG